jgi:hypothetical protein
LPVSGAFTSGASFENGEVIKIPFLNRRIVVYFEAAVVEIDPISFPEG